MRIIYEPRGRALEYAPLAVSLYRGCPHGCIYCFAPDSTKTEREKFLKSYVRKDCLKLLEKDAMELEAARDEREILMSFTTDPYQPMEVDCGITRGAIKILINHGLHFTILTKGGTRSARDIDLLEKVPEHVRYGTTLTFYDESDRQIWEPGASSTKNRMEALWYMKDHGLRTWVSLEPVVYPDQTLEIIRQTMGYVDEYRIGKFNHVENPELRHVLESIGYCYPSDQEWREFVHGARDLLINHGCRYIFKKDLQPYLGGDPS